MPLSHPSLRSGILALDERDQGDDAAGHGWSPQAFTLSNLHPQEFAMRPSAPPSSERLCPRQLAAQTASLVVTSVALLFSVGCAADDAPPTAEPSAPTAGFMPVDPGRSCPSPAPEWHCLTPFPSNFHRAATGGGEGGASPRMILPQQGVPITTDGERVDFVEARPFDGASVLPQIMVHIPGGVDDEGLVFHSDDLARSTLVSASATLLIDAKTGETVGHFAEIDPAPAHVDHRALLIRPMRPLSWGRRYVVVVQRLRRPDGTPIARTPTFERLLTDEGETATERAQAAYYSAHILPLLDTLGVSREELVLAWDFTTASKPSVQGRVAAMADDARTQIAAGLFGALTVTEQQPGSNAETAWWLEGEITLPAYVSGDAHPSPHMTTHATKAFTLPFRVLISRAAEATLKAGGTPPVIIMGHGFFGDVSELASGGYRKAAQSAGAIAIGVDWWGLAKQDVAPVVGGLVAKLAPLLTLVDRLEQGLVNVVALAALTRRAGPPSGQGATAMGLTDLTLPGTAHPLLQPKAPLGYYGCSLGHILGSTAVSLSPDIERAAVQVGGAGFGQIMTRSLPFGSMQTILAGRFANQGDTLLALMQLAEALAPVDPASWVDEMRTSAAGGVRPVLLHIGIHDASVPTFTAEVHARGLEIPLLTPSPRAVWGLKSAPAQGATGGLVEIDFKVPNPAQFAIAPVKENKVHDGVRHLKPVVTQIGAFLRGEPIPAACSGPCDPD